MRNLNKYLFITSILLIYLFGCSDDPGKTGIGLVSPEDTLQIQHYTTTATSEVSYLYRINGQTSTLVGKHESIEARALIQFPKLTSLPDSAIIDSAILKIPINYVFKDTLGRVAFSIHKILTSWEISKFTWDSSEVAGFYAGTPELSYNYNLNIGDTALFISLIDIIDNWRVNSADTIFGIIFIPNLSITNTIAGAVNVSPVLKVNYRNNSEDTTNTINVIPSLQTYVANGLIPSSDSHLFLQAGIGYRGLLRFDSLSLPRSVSITEAILKFTLDENISSFNPSTRDTITAHFLRTNIYPYDTIALGTVCSPSPENGKKVYKGNITSMVQQWVIGMPNYGIILRPLGEYSTFDRFAIYGSSDSLKPIITITYTVFP